jgi:hypothetical protein
MNFRTRIDFTNRQAKQNEKTEVTLSGGTTFGLPYSALTSGPDLSMSAVTFEDIALISTYSGNTGTTVYTWGDFRQEVNEGELSALTPTNSGTTQGPVGPTWTGYDMFTTIDGYTGWTSYSAVTYDVHVSSMVDLGGGAYSGVVQSDFSALSASSTDYTGSTIWVDVSGITRTDEIIITKGAVYGYVLKSDANGLGSWQVDGSGSTFTGNTSIACISDIWVSNIHSCSPLHINPNNEGNIYFGELSANTFNLTNNRLGIGLVGTGSRTTDPLDAIELGEGEWIGFNTTIAPSATSTAGIHFKEGVGSGNLGYGVDMYYNATSGTDRLIMEGMFNNISQGGITIQRNGNVTIGMDTTGSTTTQTLQIGEVGGVATLKYVDGNQSDGYILTSDDDGIATWQFIDTLWSGGTGANSAVLVNSNITSSLPNTVYVPDLVIDGLTSTDPIATNASGLIVAGASDSRLKTKINVLESALDKVKKLRGVSYEWTKESGMGDGIKKYGLIAQEVQEVIPDMVRKRSKGDGMLTLSYTEIVPWLIEAIKELSTGVTRTDNKIILETQTIVSEDNNIELNYGGNIDTAVGGGITVLNSVGDGVNSEIKTNINGDWVMNPPLKIKKYTPTSTDDTFGEVGETIWDDDYTYIKTNNGWKRTSLENF